MTSLIPASPNTSSGLSFGRQKAKDPGKVFVAGATGQVGIRIAQILLCEFYSVRVGVSDLGATQELARLAISYKDFKKLLQLAVLETNHRMVLKKGQTDSYPCVQNEERDKESDEDIELTREDFWVVDICQYQ
ncbi:hypothetical protein FXO37_08441 [Capsicum annuum]|nr:hypothetical protein FXO37_08441 [Capsicum annuum]